MEVVYSSVWGGVRGYAARGEGALHVVAALHENEVQNK